MQSKATNMMKRTISLAALFIFSTLATTQAADAKANWDKHCAKCHGAEGKGDTKMGKRLSVRDYTDPKVQAAMTDEEMIKIIKEGKKEKGKTLMKGYKELSDAETKALVAFIRDLKK